MHFGGGHFLVLAHFTKEEEFLGLRGVWWTLVGVNTHAFEKIKCIFSIAPVENLEKSRECFSLRKHSPDAGPEAPNVVSVRLVYRLPSSARVRHRTPGTGRRLERPMF